MAQPNDDEARKGAFRGVYLVADDDEFFRMALSAILRQKLGGAEIMKPALSMRQSSSSRRGATSL